MTVGRMESHVFTSREAHIDALLEKGLSADRQTTYKLASEDSKAFFEQVDRLILNYLIAEEASHFAAVKLSDEEFEKEVNKVPAQLFQSQSWKSLGSHSKEWREILRRQVQAEKFIDFRAQSSVIPVSDVEAKRYFDENRLKFGRLPFEQFKENIKVFLRRSQVERRLKDWYEVLRSKYKARNFLSEI